MKKYVIALLVCFTTIALAEEFPCLPGVQNAPEPAQYRHDQIEPLVVTEPVWKTLERMPLDERKNSEIDLVLQRDATPQALQMADRIEDLWNGGKFEEALSLFPELETLTDVNEMAIGNSWRTPVPIEEGICWNTDVRIGNRDSVLVTALDIHRSTSNLFAVLLLQGDGNTNRWDVYISTDDGANWSETYDWWANYDINSLSASVVAYHCYVGFSRGFAQDEALLYRFSVLDGAQEDFSGGSDYVTVFTTTSPDSLKEVALTSNQDYFNDRLYYIAITTQGNLRYFWAYEPDFDDWSEIATNVTNAKKGLDATCNEGYADYFLWTSYVNTANQLQIDGRATTWDSITTYETGTAVDYTAIGAYDDTVTSFFEYHGSGYQVRYLVSYDAGTNWLWGYVDDTTTISESPDVAARKGGGVAAVYRFYTPTHEARYTWRDYAGSWETPVSYSDHEPYWNKPSIEYIGGGIFGVVYLTWNSPQTRAAYFDWHVQTSVDDRQLSFPASFVLLQNHPNPFNARTLIGYCLPRSMEVSIEVYDVLGRKIETLASGHQPGGYHEVSWYVGEVPSGIYFYRIQAGENTETRKMLLLR